MQLPSLRIALAASLGALAALPAAAQAQAEQLENTYWKLTELAGKPAFAVPEQREPHIVLQAGDKPSLRGSGGCNRLVGSYRLKGTAIEFGPVASTRMACARGMDQEQDMLEALAAVRMWKIQARQLDLCDADGKLLARFEAREQK